MTTCCANILPQSSSTETHTKGSKSIHNCLQKVVSSDRRTALSGLEDLSDAIGGNNDDPADPMRYSNE